MRTRHRVAGILAIAVLALALPASAQPGVTVPTTPPPASPGAPAKGACSACADPVEHQGPFVSLGLDMAPTGPQGVVIGDLQLGWMLAPWIGVFMSIDGLVGDESAARLWGAGLRLASGAAFAELRLLAIGANGECDDCGDAPRLVMFGGGVEILRGEHAALDLHLHLLTDGRETVPLLGAGLGFHF